MFMLIFLQVTFRDLLSDIPHDAGAFVAYGMLALIVALIWAGSRNGGKSRTDPARPEDGDNAK